MSHKNATNYGIDISNWRLDDVDKEVISFALSHKGIKNAVNIGSGASRVSIMLALIGFNVYLYDIRDLSDYYSRVGDILGIGDKIHFINIDLNNVEEFNKALPDRISIIVGQRIVHHLRYDITDDIFRHLYRKVIYGGGLFMSVSGIDSKLAKGYKCRTILINDRFCKVGKTGIDVYNILGNVCLYSKKEVGHLLTANNFVIKKIYVSAFGNIKSIAFKKKKSIINNIRMYLQKIYYTN